MATKPPATAIARDYQSIVDLRAQLKKERQKTCEMFKSNQVTAQEVVERLTRSATGRFGKGYESDPRLAYYKDLVWRMAHCHQRRYFTESAAKVNSEFLEKGLSTKGLLEGTMGKKLEQYYIQYKKDVALEEKLRKQEADFLEEHGERPPSPRYKIPDRPKPFEFIPDDGHPPDMFEPLPDASESEDNPSDDNPSTPGAFEAIFGMMLGYSGPDMLNRISQRSDEEGPGLGPATFTITKSWKVTLIYTFPHGRDVEGDVAPGTIGLRAADGATYGPWKATGTAHFAAVGPLAAIVGGNDAAAPNSIWEASPNVVIPRGVYTLVVSDPECWLGSAMALGIRAKSLAVS